MDTDDLWTIAAVAAVAYVAYRLTVGKPWNQETAKQGLEGAGFTTYRSSVLRDGAIYARSGDTTFKFNEGDAERLNFAQRTLITLDKIVPGTWLSRLALT